MGKNDFSFKHIASHEWRTLRICQSIAVARLVFSRNDNGSHSRHRKKSTQHELKGSHDKRNPSSCVSSWSHTHRTMANIYRKERRPMMPGREEWDNNWPDIHHDRHVPKHFGVDSFSDHNPLLSAGLYWGMCFLERHHSLWEIIPTMKDASSLESYFRQSVQLWFGAI